MTVTEGDSVQLVPLSPTVQDRLLVAALAAVGAGLIAANPMSPSTDWQASSTGRSR